MLGSWMLKCLIRRLSEIAMGGKKRAAQPRMGEDLQNAITALDHGYTTVVELLHGQERLVRQLRAELMEARKVVGQESSGSGSRPLEPEKECVM